MKLWSLINKKLDPVGEKKLQDTENAIDKGMYFTVHTKKSK